MRPLTVAFIIAFSLLFAAPALQAECAPPLIGSPCAIGGIASASQAEPSLTLAAGNPIHLVTGNKTQRETDLPANPSAPGLELIRHYNALDTRPSVLGRGWALSYDTRLFRVNSGWQIAQADGARVDFPDTSTGPNGTHKTRHGRLDHVNGYHNWFWPSGTTLRFDPQGWLVAIRWRNGESVYLTRHTDAGLLNGAIQRVHNDHAQTLTFHYDTVGAHARLIAVDTPLGHFRYDYDQPDSGNPSSERHTTPRPYRLTRMTRPDGMRRHYLHDTTLQAGHAYALTGIEISSKKSRRRQRVSTWEYDTQGRAIRSLTDSANNAQKSVRLDYQRTPSTDQPGLTVVSNEHQQKTWFHTALKGHRYVLTAVQGAGCAGCAAPGTQADYDDQGRLVHINGTDIQRTPTGAITALQPARSGWPGLTLGYDTEGRRDYWMSAATGKEHIQYDAQSLPLERRFANGDSARVQYDNQHRPVSIHEKHGDAQTTTRLSWQGHHLIRIEHPLETESRRYDDKGRIAERHITRNNEATRLPLSMSERFRYDDHHRLIRHHLPEGGSLRYDWGQGPQLKAIYWQDINGFQHRIIDTLPGQAGYRYGNDLHLDTAAGAHHMIRQLRLRHQDRLLWAQELTFDSQHRIATETVSASRRALSSMPDVIARRYAYDADSRLIGHQRADNIAGSHDNPAPVATWLAWGSDGAAAATRTQGQTNRPLNRRDRSGLVHHIDGYDLTYSPSRRLNSVMRDGQLVAQYQHNAFGYRITRNSVKQGRTDYFYLNNQLVAQKEHPYAAVVTRRYIYAHHVPVALIDYTAQAPQGRYFAIHADALGAPRLITDSNRQIRWHADYSPLGQADQLAGDMRLDLRLPGQIEDPETGWHDNLLRTYLPQWGHYLEPDPLGPLPGNQAYGYAAQQPRRFSDPMGLLLFAFDGTRHSADTRSNVWKMSQYYLDGPVHYHPGPGNSMFIDWDALAAHHVSQTLDTQWKWLLYELSRPQAAGQVIPIDILGFSRGAALARHFGNMIHQHIDAGLFQFNDPFYGSVSACVDLRFMGLFDTVAQFGIAGTQNRNYDLSIASAWEWVAHAVALHERRWLFPLTSASDTQAGNVVEAPFIGAHSDIGGGVLPANEGKPGGRGDLSDLTLNWMVWQARAASVRFGDLDDDDRTVTAPVLHDFRAPAIRQLQDGDRSIDAASGESWLNYQDDHARLGRERREQTEHLITRVENWRASGGVEVGIVDMDGYARWLHDELGWHAFPV